jgi:hypothetical protein
MIAEAKRQMLVYFACFLKTAKVYTTIRKPVSSKPRLNIGATTLFTECPRSLRAFFCQLNQGENIIETPIEK